MEGDRILCVDDEPHVLAGYKRALRKRFDIQVAEGPVKGLRALASEGPFSVVVSDYRMPGMNGVEFLARAAQESPDSPRIMLTGFADTETAIGAVNKGEIFRFLTKPCPPDHFARALDDGIKQRKLVLAERELLEQTLQGCVQVLIETLSLANPAAFSQAARIKRIIGYGTRALKLTEPWQYGVAAMLSQIGCIILPNELVLKVHAREPLTEDERALYASHPETGARLIAKVPRLDSVAEMIRRHLTEPAIRGPVRTADPVAVGAQLLRVGSQLDRYFLTGLRVPKALAKLRNEPTQYTTEIVRRLEGLEFAHADAIVREVSLTELQEGMLLQEDIRGPDGLLLIASGHEVTYAVIERLRRATKRFRLDKTVTVRMPERSPPPNSDNTQE